MKHKVGHTYPHPLRSFEWCNPKWDAVLSHKGRTLYKRGAFWFYVVPGFKKAFHTFEEASTYVDHVNNCYGGL